MIHIFAGIHYYADGGMHDYVGHTNTLDNGKAWLHNARNNKGQNYQWAHLAELKEDKLVLAAWGALTDGKWVWEDKSDPKG